MNERYCIRGCTVRGQHYATCDRHGPDYEGDSPCHGCALVDARDGALICERCFRSLRRHLEDAADLVGHLRSIADPTKATVFDRVRVQSSMPELPAPVAADLIDASDDITRTLNMWADHVAGEDRAAAGLWAGADAAGAHDAVRLAADVVLDELDQLANDSHQIVALCDGVIVVHQGAPAVWTVADAAVRWTLDDRPRWATAPCPAVFRDGKKCDLRTVRVDPGRNGRPTRYRCTTCGWEANDLDDGGLWAEVFAEPIPLGDGTPHDPRWMTLSDAAALVKRTAGTVRGWILADDLERVDGRVWRDDVLAVAAQKRGEAA